MLVGHAADGHPTHVDLSQAPHVLLCGTSGSGKSVGVHAILAGLITGGTPKDTQITIMDPKRVEFRIWERAPHVACVVTDRQAMVDTIKAMVTEMDRRYAVMERAGVADMPEGMPRLFLVCDELADLTMASRDRAANLQSQLVLGGLTRIAQLGRAAGVHLIVATQRPAADTLPGNLRANLGTRWAFRVRTRAESRIALDAPGAESLGQSPGTSLLSWRGAPGVFVQGLYVDRDQITELVSDAAAEYGRRRLCAPRTGDARGVGSLGRVLGSMPATGRVALAAGLAGYVVVMTVYGGK